MSDTTYAPTQAASNEDSKRNPHGSFIWYELITPDPDGAKKFYDAVVGWNIEAKPSGEMDYRMIGVADGLAGGVMRLTDEMQSHGARPTWLGYIGVDDVDQSVAAIEQDGGKALMPAFDIPDVGRIAMVADPQGAPFYVMRGATDEASHAFSPIELGHVAWNELTASDLAGALDFYTTRFNWEKGDTMPMGDMGDYQFINHAGQTIGAMMTAPPGERPRWRFYFKVANADEAKTAIEAGGGTVTHGPAEVPGGDRILIGTDPQGAEFAIVGK